MSKIEVPYSDTTNSSVPMVYSQSDHEEFTDMYEFMDHANKRIIGLMRELKQKEDMLLKAGQELAKEQADGWKAINRMEEYKDLSENLSEKLKKAEAKNKEYENIKKGFLCDRSIEHYQIWMNYIYSLSTFFKCQPERKAHFPDHLCAIEGMVKYLTGKLEESESENKDLKDKYIKEQGEGHRAIDRMEEYKDLSEKLLKENKELKEKVEKKDALIEMIRKDRYEFIEYLLTAKLNQLGDVTPLEFLKNGDDDTIRDLLATFRRMLG